jgi:multiple antibiotic resistance protein
MSKNIIFFSTLGDLHVDAIDIGAGLKAWEPGTRQIAPGYLFGNRSGDRFQAVGLFGVVVLALAITYALMRLTPTVMRVMGVTGAHVVSRLAGVVLAALAVQFIIDGLGGAFGGI